MVTNEQAIESSIESMGSRWGRRGTCAAGLRGVGAERERAVVCGVGRWGREQVGQGGLALAVTHRATQLLGPDLGDPAQREQGQHAG